MKKIPKKSLAAAVICSAAGTPALAQGTVSQPPAAPSCESVSEGHCAPPRDAQRSAAPSLDAPPPPGGTLPPPGVRPPPGDAGALGGLPPLGPADSPSVPELFMMALPTNEVSVIGPGGMSLGSKPLDMRSVPHVMPPGALGMLGPVDLLPGFDELRGPPPQPNGFVFRGVQLDAMGGSYGRRQGLLQAGHQMGDLAVFAAVSGLKDQGFVPVSESEVRHFHGDVGLRRGRNEFHVVMHSTANTIEPQQQQTLSGVAQVPWTSPSAKREENHQIGVTADLVLDGGWLASGAFKFGKTPKDYSETVVLQSTSAAPPPPGGGAEAPPASTGPSGILTTLASQTNARSLTGKLANLGQVFGRPNQFTVGINYNGGTTVSETHSYISSLDNNYKLQSIVMELNGNGGIFPQQVSAKTDYIDAFVSDVFHATDRLKISAGGRFNRSRIEQYDLLGTAPASAGNHSFTRFSPSLGTTYTVTPSLVAYGGYAQTSRVFTPVGLLCDNIESPCSMRPSFFVTEAVQKQSVAHTYNLGLRGQLPPVQVTVPVQLAWHAGIYRSDTSDESYLYIDVTKPGRPVYYNIGNTRRQGAKLGLDVAAGAFSASILYNYAHDTFRSPVTLYNPLNSAADASGNIYVTPGSTIPLSPKHSLNVLSKYRFSDRWVVGTSMRGVSSRYYNGDEVNAMKKLPGYFVVSFNLQYRVNQDLELFGLLENAFNKDAAVFGALVAGGTAEQNPRWTRGQPRSLYGGLRWKF